MELHSWFKIIKIIDYNKIEIEDQIGKKYTLYIQDDPHEYELNEFLLMYIEFSQVPGYSFIGMITGIIGGNKE